MYGDICIFLCIHYVWDIISFSFILDGRAFSNWNTQRSSYWLKHRGIWYSIEPRIPLRHNSIYLIVNFTTQSTRVSTVVWWDVLMDQWERPGPLQWGLWQRPALCTGSAEKAHGEKCAEVVISNISLCKDSALKPNSWVAGRPNVSGSINGRWSKLHNMQSPIAI